MTPYFASPTGTDSATGTLTDPMSPQKALSQRAGDELRLLPGNYKHPDRRPGTMGWPITAKGTADNPLVIHPHEGRVTIDGGLQSGDWSPPEYVTIMGLEVIVSENLTESRTSAYAGSGAPPDLLRPWGGIDIRSGKEINIVNCVVHDNMQGIGHWSNVSGLMYGNIVYRNGWVGSDRKHGHGVYMQNKEGRKLVKHNLLLNNYSMNLQAYGSDQAYFNFMDFIGNSFSGAPFLIGGGRPMSDVTVLYNWGAGGSLQIGYGNVAGDNVRVEWNNIAHDLATHPGFTDFRRFSNRWRQIGWSQPRTERENGDRIGVDAPISALLVRVAQNEYDTDVSYVTLLNFTGTVQTTLLSLAEGEKLFDPLNFFGEPVSDLVDVLPGAIAMYVVRKVSAPVPELTLSAGEDFEATRNRWYSLDGSVETDREYALGWSTDSNKVVIETPETLNSRVKFRAAGECTLTLTATSNGKTYQDQVKVTVTK